MTIQCTLLPLPPSSQTSITPLRKKNKYDEITPIPTNDGYSAVLGLQKQVFSMTPITPPRELSGCSIKNLPYAATPNPALQKSYILPEKGSSLQELLDPSQKTSRTASSYRAVVSEKAEQTFQQAWRDCSKNHNCTKLKDFANTIQGDPHLRKEYDSKLFFRATLPIDPQCPLWPSDTDPRRSRIIHKTNTTGLEGILRTGTLEARKDFNTWITGNEKGVYLSVDGYWTSFRTYTLIFKQTVLLDKTPNNTTFDASEGTIRTNSISISPDTLEAIAVAYVHDGDFEEVKKECKRLAGWDVPVIRYDEVRNELEAINPPCGVILPRQFKSSTDDSDLRNPHPPFQIFDRE